ncbi:MAG: glycosyltransferase [bacterium]
MSKKTIIFTGGGTLGPVMPLLAVVDELKDSGYNLVWVGTRKGVEGEIIRQKGLAFHSLPVFKLPRYVSLEWIIGPLKLLWIIPKCFWLCLKYRPAVVVSAGGFSGVWLSWVAKMFGSKILLHQQDIRPSLSNVLVKPIANAITVAFEESKMFFGGNALVIGNPVRKEAEKYIGYDSRVAKQSFGFDPDKPLLLVLGGGTGAESLNKLVTSCLGELLSFSQVFHCTGKGKMIGEERKGYKAVGFLIGEEMFMAMATADLVVSRAGLSTLTELACLKKAVIVVPIPNSQQEENAKYIVDRQAGVMLDETKFVMMARELLENIEKRNRLGENLHRLFKEGARERLTDVIEELAEK